MDSRIVNILAEIQDEYGDMVFYDTQKTKNLLNDFAPRLHKERIHIGQFLEQNGYFQLKYAGHSFPLVSSRLVQNYASIYGVTEDTARSVVGVFAELLGYSDFKNLDKLIKHDISPEAMVALMDTEEVVKEYVADESFAKLQATHETSSIKTPIQISQTVVVKKDFHLPSRISADMHSVVVLPNGRVVAAGQNSYGQCNVDDWRDIIAVSAGPNFTLGLREDGYVVACGRNEYQQCNVGRWRDVVAISAGARHSLGLLANGKVVATGQNKNGECNVRSWHNVAHISAGYLCSFGIKKDSTVLVKGNIKTESIHHLSSIKDIVNPYLYRGLALKKNGRLAQLISLEQSALQNTVKKWRGLTQISAGPDYFAGLFEDGTVRVLAYYWRPNGIELNASDWTDISAIAAGRFHLLGVKKDGTMVSVMMHPSKDMNKGQCEVRDWVLL